MERTVTRAGLVLRTSRADPEPGSEKRIARIEALSDGVFSIALTLLIMDVVAAGKKVGDGRTLWQHLLHEWPVPVAYLVGFLTILVCWVNQQKVFRYLKRADSGLLWVCGLQLMLVSSVPLPTALLSEHLQDADRTTALLLYGATFWGIATSFWLLWWYCEGRGLSEPTVDPDRYSGTGRIYAISVAWTTLAMPVAYHLPYLALAMWAVMFAAFAFPGEFAYALRRRR